MPVVQDQLDPTPVPISRVILLGLILAANNTSLWMIFSFLPFMVAHYFPTLPLTQLGYEAGMLGSAFSAGSLLGNVLWGIVSDRAGRRPTLLCGLLGTGKLHNCIVFASF
jgi:MFS family permease